MLFRSQELKLKEQDLQRKALKDAADIKVKNKQIQVDALKAAAEMKTRITEDKANRNMDMLKTAAELTQEHRIHQRDTALDLLDQTNKLHERINKPNKGE